MAIAAALGATVAGGGLPAVAWATLLGGALGGILARVFQRRVGRSLDAATAIIGGGRQISWGELGTAAEDFARRERAAGHAAEQRAALKEGYLETVVHEIRNPLSTIHASVELVLAGFAETPEDRTECLGQAKTACQHALFLITDLLDAAAIAAGTLRIETRPTEVGAVLTTAGTLAQPLAQARDVELEIESSSHGPDPLLVTADHNRMLQVLLNLISNALKFSDPDSRVTVRVESSPMGVVFEVVDQGWGVPAETRSRLFTRFGRAHDDGDAPSGTGIGLHLCKVLVERMGGSIGYEPGPGGTGSVFWFSLRAAAPAEASKSATPTATEAGG